MGNTRRPPAMQSSWDCSRHQTLISNSLLLNKVNSFLFFIHTLIHDVPSPERDSSMVQGELRNRQEVKKENLEEKVYV